MIVGEPPRSLKNPVFQLKMALLVAALVATSLCGSFCGGMRLRRPRKQPERRGRDAREHLDAALGGHHLRRPVDRLLLLASRFRSSQTLTAPFDANFGLGGISNSHHERRGLHVMDFDQFLNWLQDTPIAIAIREHEILFPWIESFHVLAIVLVVGPSRSSTCASSDLPRATAP